MDIANGTKISFQSKAPNDNNLYKGEVIGSVTSDVASNYDDIYTYHSNVKAGDPTIGDVKTLEFLLVQTGEDAHGILAFAQEWILAETLKIISTTGVGTFEVHGVADSIEAQNIIDALQAVGYNATLVKIS